MKYSKARSKKTNTIYVAHIPSNCELLPPEDTDWKYNMTEKEFNLSIGNYVGDVMLQGKRCKLYEAAKLKDRI